MSKYTVGFLLAAAGLVLYMRAKVNAREHTFILFVKSNIFQVIEAQLGNEQMSRLHMESKEVFLTQPEIYKLQAETGNSREIKRDTEHVLHKGTFEMSIIY